MEGKLKIINIIRFFINMFLSSYENKIDKKGRVSVPATFRSHLSSMGYNGFISYPLLNHSALKLVHKIELKNFQIQLIL